MWLLVVSATFSMLAGPKDASTIDLMNIYTAYISNHSTNIARLFKNFHAGVQIVEKLIAPKEEVMFSICYESKSFLDLPAAYLHP